MGGYGATTELPEHCRIFVIWLVLRAPTDNVAAAEQALRKRFSPPHDSDLRASVTQLCPDPKASGGRCVRRIFPPVPVLMLRVTYARR